MKLKNIQTVTPIWKYGQLAEIYCVHEELGKSNWLREKLFLNKNAKIIAHFQYKEAFNCRQLTDKYSNLFVVKMLSDKKYNIIKAFDNEKYLINSYEDIEFGVEDGCFAVQNDGLWGFINEEAEEIITPQYEDYCAFCSGYAAVCENDKWGFINKLNEVVIPFEYEIPGFSCFNRYAPVGKNGKFGYIDMLGETVIPFKYDSAMCIFKNCGIFPVKLNGKWGFIDKDENEVIPFEYDNIECNPDGYDLYEVEKNIDGINYLGIIDPIKRKLIIPCENRSLVVNTNSICVGNIIFENQEAYTLVDYNNKLSDFVYEKIGDYTNDVGLYEAKLNGKYGYIDETGRVMIDFKYYRVNPFFGSYAVVENYDRTNEIINKNGEVVFEPTDKQIFNLGEGMFFVQGSNSKEYELVKLEE